MALALELFLVFFRIQMIKDIFCSSKTSSQINLAQIESLALNVKQGKHEQYHIT
jgi:hypothetical protein